MYPFFSYMIPVVRGYVRVRVRTMNKERFRMYPGDCRGKTRSEDLWYLGNTTPGGGWKISEGAPLNLRPPLEIYTEKKPVGPQHETRSTKLESTITRCVMRAKAMDDPRFRNSSVVAESGWGSVPLIS
jgi:hypothetical protein